MKDLQTRISAVQAAIEKENEVMKAILADNGADLPEHLDDEDEAELWSQSFKVRKSLTAQLQRIDSILNICENTIMLDCS